MVNFPFQQQFNSGQVFQLFGGYGFIPCFSNKVSSLTVAMYQWLAKAHPHLKGRYDSPKMLGLLDPNTTPSTEVAKTATTFESADSAVDEAILKTSTTTSKTSKKHGRYFDYNDS